MLSSSSSTSLRDVPGHTSLNFYVPVGHEQPYQYFFTPPEGIAHNNLDSPARPIVVLMTSVAAKASTICTRPAFSTCAGRAHREN